MNLTALLVPSFRQVLTAMNGWLDKAAAQATAAGDDPDALLTLRLAPDMYPLASQIRFACFLSLDAVYQLSSGTTPESVLAIRQAAWDGGEKPGTLAQAKACNADALEYLSGLAEGALVAQPEQTIAIELPNLAFDMTAETFARDWALPQVYFHASIAYALLRAHGVPLGKADLVPHMFAYMRPGAAAPA